MFNKLIALTLGAAACLALFPSQAQAGIIESYTDTLKKADGVKLISSPVRAGTKAFEHSISGGNRAELSFGKTEIGGTYWKGWSVFIPKDFKSGGTYTIIGQWAAYPSKRDKKFPCGAVGHRMDIRDNGDMEVRFQPLGLKDKCIKYKLGNISTMRGKWVDFGEHAKWSEKDGFFKLWMAVDGGALKQVIDHKGHTWWSDEDKGPYWKMGAYLGGEGAGGKQKIITDEYRLGDSKSSLQEVLPFVK